MTTNSADISKFMETWLEIEESQAVTVKISHREAVQIVVNDLTDKYKFNVGRGDMEWAGAFEKVLRYYMTRDEVDEIKGEATPWPPTPANPSRLNATAHPASTGTPGTLSRRRGTRSATERHTAWSRAHRARCVNRARRYMRHRKRGRVSRSRASPAHQPGFFVAFRLSNT